MNKTSGAPSSIGKGASLCLVVTVASAHDSDDVLSSYFFLRLP